MMVRQFGIRDMLERHPVIPVVNIQSLDEVEPMVERLLAQNIHCIEITLRSDCALQAIEKTIRIKPEGFDVGVGTIVSPDQVMDCVSKKVDFMVSPGLSKGVAVAFEESGIPFLPGVMTPSDIISGMGKGWDTFKLFPFNVAGGMTALKSYSGVFPGVRFCPTGGVKASNYKEILAMEHVISVGGSWIAKS